MAVDAVVVVGGGGAAVVVVAVVVGVGVVVAGRVDAFVAADDVADVVIVAVGVGPCCCCCCVYRCPLVVCDCLVVGCRVAVFVWVLLLLSMWLLLVVV